MALSSQSLEILLDLIEIKVSAIQIQDRDDARELNKLRKCRQELLLEMNQKKPTTEKTLNNSSFSTRAYRRTSYSRY